MEISNQLKTFEDELRRRRYAENSIQSYLSYCSVFLEKHKHKDSVKHISEQDIKSFLGSFNQHNTQRAYHSAIKSFYKYVAKQPNKFRYIQYCRRSNKLPIVLSQQEVQKMFDSCENLKHKVILALLYSTGMRSGELVNLKWAHLDRHRGIINIVGGKGGKDRQVMLSSDIIPLLERYYRAYKPNIYVLNGQTELQYTQSSVLQVVKQVAQRAKLNKRVYTHLMRHNTFTHMIESGVDISVIQKLAGHGSVRTTQLYTHISCNLIANTYSPMKNILI